MADSIKGAFGVRLTVEKIWMSTKYKDLTRKMRAFLWKATQDAYKVGNYWTQIERYQERGVYLICTEVEDMDHVLNRCMAGTCKKAWQLVSNLWARRDALDMPNSLGGVLGCGLVAHSTIEGKPNGGKK